MSRQLLLGRTGEPTIDRNMDRIQGQLADLRQKLLDFLTDEVSLVSGDNVVAPSIPRPRARITAYLSAAVTLYDKGLQADGTWVVNSSGTATARFLFI